jgi:hypothetical protein
MTTADAEGYLMEEHHLRRADARALLAAQENVLWTRQVDAARAGRPKLWHPVNSYQAPFVEGSAAETPREESPALTPPDEGDISADRMDRVRRKYAPTETRINSSDLVEPVSAAATDSKDGEERL